MKSLPEAQTTFNAGGEQDIYNFVATAQVIHHRNCIPRRRQREWSGGCIQNQKKDQGLWPECTFQRVLRK